MPSHPSRGTLLRWIAWFGIANAVLFALAGVRYLLAFGMPESVLALLYVVLASISQFALLGFLPLMLVLGPVALLIPRKGLVLTLGVCLMALALTVLVLDTNVFAQYRYHLSLLTVEIFAASTWVFAGIILFVALLFESMLAGIIWQRVQARRGRPGVWLALSLVCIGLIAQGIHVWADAVAYTPITSFTRFLPAYFPLKAKRRLAKLGWIDPAKVEQDRLLRRASAPDAGQLRYPLAPLTCNTTGDLPDIQFILIDALRPDMVDAGHTPRIAQFAAEGQHFANHYSGGNSSRMGIFSMFYGLPSTYWQAFHALQLPPVLMEQLQVHDYDIKAFSAVGFGSPAEIDRTVFAAVDAAQRFSARKKDGNGEIKQAWQSWLTGRVASDRPFFSLLYFDPGQSSINPDANAATRSELEKTYAAYVLGIAEVDKLVAEILLTLQQRNSERDTLIIIASDHGYEFDELGLGNVGHGSNYARYQLGSVLLMDWPGRAPRKFEHRSAHQDLPGTLLHELFGCSNPYSDYSSGGNLFAAQSWQWIIAGSYNSWAIVEPDKIVVTNPGGLVELLGPDYKPNPELQLDPQRIEEVMLEMRRFYK
jgi:membrane-anchored protein YejM (alkaline phosphatase superfamily)